MRKIAAGWTAGWLLAAAAAAQTVDGAREGSAARRVRTERFVGRISFRGRESDPIVIEVKRPDRVRVEVDLPRGAFLAGFDGSTAWQVDPRLSPGRAVPLPTLLARRISEIADIDGPLARWKSAGRPFRVEPLEPENGERALRVEADEPDGTVSTLEVDPESGRARKWRGRLGEGRRARDVEVAFSDERELDGVFFPSCVSAGRAREPPALVIELDRLELDPEIDDAWFAPPPTP